MFYLALAVARLSGQAHDGLQLLINVSLNHFLRVSRKHRDNIVI